MDVTQLTDAELIEALRKHGDNPGPIVRSTRAIYEKKLLRMLGGGDVVQSQSNTSSVLTALSTDDVEDDVEEAMVMPQEINASPLRRRNLGVSSPRNPTNVQNSHDSESEAGEESFRILTPEEIKASRSVRRSPSPKNTSHLSWPTKLVAFMFLAGVTLVFIYFLSDNVHKATLEKASM